jgi:hypothetical protein
VPGLPAPHRDRSKFFCHKGIVAVKIEPISANEACTRLWKSEIHFDGIFEGLGVQPHTRTFCYSPQIRAPLHSTSDQKVQLSVPPCPIDLDRVGAIRASLSRPSRFVPASTNSFGTRSNPLISTSYMLNGPTSIATRHTSSLNCLPAENCCTSSMTS